MAGKNLQVTISGDPSSLLRAVKAAERSMGDLSKTSATESRKVEADHERMSKSFGHIAKSAAGALGAIGLVYEGFHKAHEAIEVTDELSKATARLTGNLGLTTKQASEWAAVAQARGIDNAKLTTSFTILSKATEAATGGADKHRQAVEALAAKQAAAYATAVRSAAGAKDQGAAQQKLADLQAKQALAMDTLTSKSTRQLQAFKDLGLTTDDLKRGQTDFNFLLGKVADGFEKLPAGTKRVSDATVVLGKGYTSLLPVLADGSKGIKEQTDLADKYGATLTNKTTKSLAEMRAEQREMKIAQLGLKVQITNEILPTWIKFEEATLKVAKAFAGPGSLDEKIKRVGKTIGPVVQEIKAEILNDIPKIADEVGREAPKVAGAFVKGFADADVWGKLAIGAFLLKRFGGLGPALTLGKSIGAKLGTGIAEGEAATAPLGPAAATGAGAGAGGVASKLGRYGPAVGGIAAGATAAVAIGGGFKALSDALKGNDFSDKGILGRYKKQLDDVAKSGDAPAMRNLAKNLREAAQANQDLTKGTDLKRVADQLDAAAAAGVKFGQSTTPISAVDKYLKRLSPTAKQVNASFLGIEKTSGSVMDAIRGNVASNIDRIRKDLGTKSEQGRQALATNFGGAASAIQRAMDDGTVSTSKGLAEIHGLMSSALKTYGISTAQLAHYFSQTNFTAGINAGVLAGPVKPSGKAGGGWIGGPGQAGQDTVPTLLGVGEAVLNRHQQAPVEAALRNTYGMGLDDLFAKIQRPHYMASGGFAGIGVTGGAVVGQIADRGLRAEQGILGGALQSLKAAASSAGVVGPAGGPKGLATFGGVTMAKWIANELAWATAHGWHGQPTSGYRPGFDPHTATGASEHQGTQYPHGAVDFGGFVDPAAKATKMALLALADRLGYPGPRLVAPVGFSDDGHLSGTGHAAGGFLRRFAKGGRITGKVSTFGPPGEAAGPTAYGGTSAMPGIAVNPGGTPSSWNAPEALALRGKRMRVTVAGHTAILPVIDKGPSAGGRKIDITGAGVAALGIPYGSFPTDATGTAELIDGTTSSSTGGSSVSAADAAAAARTHRLATERKQTSRLLSSIITPALSGGGGYEGRGITAAGRLAARISTSISDSDASYGRLERLQGQSDEDLGTAAGRTKRVSELSALRASKQKQLGREREELAILKQQEAKLKALIKKLRATLVGRHRVKGVQAARVRTRIQGFDNDLTDVQAAIKALGGDIQDTQLDIGDLDKSIGETLATPDTASADGSDGSSGSADAPAAPPSATDQVSAALSHIDAQERAGDLTSDQAQQARIAVVQGALNGSNGALTDDQRLDLRGDLRDLMNQQAAALVDNTSALADLAVQIKRQNDISDHVMSITATTAVRALADMLSGQIAGVGLNGRQMTAGAGSVYAA